MQQLVKIEQLDVSDEVREELRSKIAGLLESAADILGKLYYYDDALIPSTNSTLSDEQHNIIITAVENMISSMLKAGRPIYDRPDPNTLTPEQRFAYGSIADWDADRANLEGLPETYRDRGL